MILTILVLSLSVIAIIYIVTKDNKYIDSSKKCIEVDVTKDIYYVKLTNDLTSFNLKKLGGVGGISLNDNFDPVILSNDRDELKQVFIDECKNIQHYYNKFNFQGFYEVYYVRYALNEIIKLKLSDLYRITRYSDINALSFNDEYTVSAKDLVTSHEDAVLKLQEHEMELINDIYKA